MNSRRVFISGMGVVSPNGVGIKEYWDNCSGGISGIKKINFLNLEGLKTNIGGFIPGINEGNVKHNLDITFYDRLSILIKFATDEALSNAGLSCNSQLLQNSGVIIGVAMGGMLSLESCYRDSFVEKTGNTFNEFLAAMPNTPANLLAMEYGARGINLTIHTACSSSTTAVGVAYTLIKNGSLDLCLTGGGEAPLTPTTIKYFEKLRLLSTKSNSNPSNACKPFSRDRMGIVLSEGSAMMVLESRASLEKRGSTPLCEIIGFGSNNDAHHIVAPNVDGEEEAIRLALSDGSIKPCEVNYIQAHGTGTKLNDKVETEAIKLVYGPNAHEIPISSVKSMIGHSLGASGSLSLVITVLSMINNFITPTINLNEPDPECNLDYTSNTGRTITINMAAVHSFGFGGNNSVLLLRHV
jgi:3-oxoacyl-(acyl-carrier-protein) synthase